MTRPVLVPRHAHRRPPEPPDRRVTRITPGALLSALFLALTSLAVVTGTGRSGPVSLGRITHVAMSDSTMSDRAERHPTYARRLGHRMIRDFGWRSDRQWACLRQLWNRESSWRVHADNPNSRAYGIPQALPGRKMSSSGSHWRRNARTQIRWGLHYVNNRYDWPCGALRHKQRHGWY